MKDNMLGIWFMKERVKIPIRRPILKEITLTLSQKMDDYKGIISKYFHNSSGFYIDQSEQMPASQKRMLSFKYSTVILVHAG